MLLIYKITDDHGGTTNSTLIYSRLGINLVQRYTCIKGHMTQKIIFSILFDLVIK